MHILSAHFFRGGGRGAHRENYWGVLGMMIKDIFASAYEELKEVNEISFR